MADRPNVLLPWLALRREGGTAAVAAKGEADGLPMAPCKVCKRSMPRLVVRPDVRYPAPAICLGCWHPDPRKPFAKQPRS